MIHPFYYNLQYRKHYSNNYGIKNFQNIMPNISSNVENFAIPISRTTNKYLFNQNFNRRNTINPQSQLEKSKKSIENFENNIQATLNGDKCILGNLIKKDSDCFEILGFKLHYDDLIIIGLILLLFSEGANDQFLIIALVLLIGD